MTYNMYAIRDIKAQFNAPGLDYNDATAIRGFGYALSQLGSLTNYAPQDYQLYMVGIFDADAGTINPVIPSRFVIDGIQALALYNRVAADGAAKNEGVKDET